MLRAVRDELGKLSRGQRLWFLWMGMFVLVWTTELFLVQRFTLVPPQNIEITNPRLFFWGPILRFSFDALMIVALAAMIPPRWLISVTIVTFFTHLGLVTYFHYLFRPLSILKLLSTWREGLEFGRFAIELFPARTTVVLAALLVVKCLLLYKARWRRFPKRVGRTIAAACAVVYFAMFLVTNRFDPLDKILTTREVARLGIARGYLEPWLAELYYLNDRTVLRMAAEYAATTRDDLTPHENSIPIQKHLVILQAESLDFNILGFEYGDQEVTPFLNRLREHAMFYRVHAAHLNGSADADFVTLNGGRPSPHVINYNIPGFAYKHPLPKVLAKAGYTTSVFHGNTGAFYNRRQAFERMGFGSINFLEELEAHYDVRANRWGALDEDVLRISKQELRTHKNDKICQVIITLTTHTPYRFLPDRAAELIPNPTNVVQRYFNNMRYLDNCLRDFFLSLEGSRTTVFLYGDHPTEVGGEGFRPDRIGTNEFIPCFIYDSTQNLAPRQKTRKLSMSQDGSLHLLDMVTYLRRQATAEHGPDRPDQRGPNLPTPKHLPADEK